MRVAKQVSRNTDIQVAAVTGTLSSGIEACMGESIPQELSIVLFTLHLPPNEEIRINPYHIAIASHIPRCQWQQE